MAKVLSAIEGTPGQVKRLFMICCMVCKETEIDTANNIDQFIDKLSQPKDGWRLTRDQGWTHKKCCKMMPQNIKF